MAAVEHYRQSLTLDEWLDQVDVELGPPSAEASARVDAQLGGTSEPCYDERVPTAGLS